MINAPKYRGNQRNRNILFTFRLATPAGSAPLQLPGIYLEPGDVAVIRGVSTNVNDIFLTDNPNPAQSLGNAPMIRVSTDALNLPGPWLSRWFIVSGSGNQFAILNVYRNWEHESFFN